MGKNCVFPSVVHCGNVNICLSHLLNYGFDTGFFFLAPLKEFIDSSTKTDSAALLDAQIRN